MDYIEARDTRQKLRSIGIDGEGAAIGLLQLCAELNRTELLDDAALQRIREAIGDHLSLSCPISAHEEYVRQRLEELFVGRRFSESKHTVAKIRQV
jgi:hypothetical protein